MSGIFHCADICRENGWTAGTRLVGHDGICTIEIEITSVFSIVIMAKIVAYDDAKVDWDVERVWRLDKREWRRVS